MNEKMRRTEKGKRERERESENDVVESGRGVCTCSSRVWGKRRKNARKNRNRTDRNRIGTDEMAGNPGKHSEYGMVW